MYFEVVAEMAQLLENLQACLDKAEAHAAARGADVASLLEARLAPDMKPLIYQVQSACDYAKGAAAWLSGMPIPRHPDVETTFPELRERIAKTVAFVRGVPEASYQGAAERQVPLSWEPGKILLGSDYLLQITIPNVLFHMSMAYAVMRNQGVDVGKMDFLGKLRLMPA
jgi:hypothetical protein